MDKSWIDKNRRYIEYINGIEMFLDFAFANAEGSNMIICACNWCELGRKCWFIRDVLTHHLMFNGFLPSYKGRVYHGNQFLSRLFQNPLVKYIVTSMLSLICSLILIL